MGELPANPFSDFGGIVRGDRFIGRHKDLRIIGDRVIRPAEPGNLAIIGEPKVGKSSLIYRAIMDRKEELHSRRRVPIWVNVALFDHGEMLFRELVLKVMDQLEDLAWTTPVIEKAATLALEDTLSWTEGYGRIQRVFQKVRDADIRVVIVLDEFDAARQLFQGDLSGFQGLRELAYRPEWRVTLVTASRRSITTIETQAGSISNLDGIFQKHYLRMFTPEDVGDLFARVESAGGLLDEPSRQEINAFCGAHPFLLERLAFSLVEQFQGVKPDLAALRRELSPEFVDYYEKISALLKEEGSLSKLLQILFGPVVDVTQVDVDDLLRHGLIEAIPESDSLRAFSEHFQEYLRRICRTADLWPLWSQAERELRGLITRYVVERYGANWPEKLEKARPKLKKMLQDCRDSQAKEERIFGSQASANLLDFTYPDNLFQIMQTEWTWFQPILSRQASDWQPAFEVLARVRTPLAHNRDSAVYESDRLKAEGFCREILDRIQKWRTQQESPPD